MTTSAAERPADDSFRRALEHAVKALDHAGIEFVLMGGVASIVLGRTHRTHDIDIFVAPVDAEPASAALEGSGFEVRESDHLWLSKAFFEGVMVDVIHRSRGPVYLDDEMVRRAVTSEIWGVEVPVMSPEDLVVTKTLAHGEHSTHYWWDALAIIAGCELDWHYLLRRARRGPRRVLSLLYYAQSDDLVVPQRVVDSLADSIAGTGTGTGDERQEG